MSQPPRRPAGHRPDPVEQIVRRARRSVSLRDLLTLWTVRTWAVLAALGGILFARWRPRSTGRAPEHNRGEKP